jgi:hypothetical protein
VIELLRASAWLYPLVQVVHILGFIVLAGAAILFDLRVLGLSPVRGSAPVEIQPLALHLLPWSLVGALLVVPSGVLMFLVEAAALIDNPAFMAKVVLLALAAGNAVGFHLGVGRSWGRWAQAQPAAQTASCGAPRPDDTPAVPAGARVHAAASLVLWIAIVGCGRLIAYL